MVSRIVSLPEYAGLRGLLLTKDAHGPYEKMDLKQLKAGP